MTITLRAQSTPSNLPDRAIEFFPFSGRDVVSNSALVRGSLFSDRIIAGPNVEAVFARAGSDIVIVTEPANGAFLGGGRGDDVYVLGGGAEPVEVRVVFDRNTTMTGTGDQIVLTNFSANSRINDLGDGRFEVIDTDGDVIIIDAVSARSAPLSITTFTESLVFGQGAITELGGSGGTPRTVIAQDVPGAVLTDEDGETTFIVDQSVQSVDAGGDNDVIQITFDEAPDASVGMAFEYLGGDGDDVVTVRESAILDFALTGDGEFVIDGGTGNDRLTIDAALGGYGEFIIKGGDGDDTVTFQEDAVLDFALTGNPDFVIDGGAGRDSLSVEIAAQNLGNLTVLGGSGNDEITVDLRGSTNGLVTVDGGAGDDTFIFFDDMDATGSTGAPLDISTFAQEGRDTLIVFTGDPETTGGVQKCFFESDGSNGDLLTLVLPDFGDTVETFTDEDGAVIFRDVETGATFGCYFCDDNLDLTARELVQSDGFATDFDMILVG